MRTVRRRISAAGRCAPPHVGVWKRNGITSPSRKPWLNGCVRRKPSRNAMDVLLAHGYYLREDPHELQVMKPYPPLGLLYIAAYLKVRGFSVGVFDATFRRPGDFAALLATERPTVVGLYCNLMTKFTILAMITAAKQVGARIVLGGPEPPYYAEEYLAHGADVVVIGEGEEALEQLISELATHGPNDLAHVPGIVFRNGEGLCVHTPLRPMIKDIDTLPFPDRDALDLN